MPLLGGRFRLAPVVLGIRSLLARLAWGWPEDRPGKVALPTGISTYNKPGFAELRLQYADRHSAPWVSGGHGVHGRS
jgi:hypothetical protein